MSEEITVKMIVQYDGTDFHGFQKQPAGMRTVQSVIEEKLSDLLNSNTSINGASRTDAGVHALGQTVSFAYSSPVPPERVAHALAPLLPPDLSAVSSERAPEGFNARFDARGKIYCYTCYKARHPWPIFRNHALNIPEIFDCERAREAMNAFVGTHDFSAFENQGSTQRDPVKTIGSFELEENPPFLKFIVHGDGFLYKMVRNMAGTAVEAGLGKISGGQIAEALSGGDRSLAGPTLPPHGLYLLKVLYGDSQKEAK